MRVVKKILKWIGIVVLLLLAAGAIYEQVGLALDAKLAPPAEEMISVDGRAVHVVCIGEGPRTFVLDSGLGGWSVYWWRLQPLLATAGRTCAFDRAGLGWSAASGANHDGLAAADELAAIVKAAKISTPFVYVGHSLGANFAQIYYARHPEDVSALVLLEPGDPKDLLEDFHGTRSEAMAAPDCGVTCYAALAAAYLGVTRLFVRNTGTHNFAGQALSEYRAAVGRPSFVFAAAAYFKALPKTAYENMDVHSFGDTPVLTLTSTAMREPEGKETVDDVKKWRVVYRAYLASLVALSTRGRGPIEIPDSNHVSMVLGEHQAAATAQAIIDFVSGAR